MSNNVTPIRPDQAKKALKFLPWMIIGLFLLLFLPSFFYSVDTEEDAVVLRFGKYNRTTGPGLHFKLPNIPGFLTIERVIKVPVRKIHKMELGFRTSKAGVRSQYNKSAYYQRESLMLTGDLNVADVEWIVQYQISNAKDFLFNVRHVPRNLEDITQAVMREVIGDRTVTEVLTTGRLDIENEASQKMQNIIDEYHMGIKLVALKLQDVNPPDKVKPSFNEVNSAKQEAEQMVNEAWKEYNNIIPEARGKADETIANAKAYKQDIVNKAKGDSQRFLSFYEEYRKAPEITKKRLYFEKLREVFQNAKQVYIVDPEVKGLVPFLNLTGKDS